MSRSSSTCGRECHQGIHSVSDERGSKWVDRGSLQGMNDEVMEFSKSQVNSRVMEIYGGKALKGT